MIRKKHGRIVVGVVVGFLLGSFVTLLTVPVFAKKPVQKPKVMGAEEFQLIDKKGKTRVVVGLTESGDLTVSLVDSTGQRRSIFTLPSLPAQDRLPPKSSG